MAGTGVMSTRSYVLGAVVASLGPAAVVVGVERFGLGSFQGLLLIVPALGALAVVFGVYERTAASTKVADQRPRWELSVDCSSGFANWDQFVYWPEENYPSTIGADSFERIGRWAYLHE